MVSLSCDESMLTQSRLPSMHMPRLCYPVALFLDLAMSPGGAVPASIINKAGIGPAKYKLSSAEHSCGEEMRCLG